MNNTNIQFNNAISNLVISADRFNVEITEVAFSKDAELLSNVISLECKLNTMTKGYLFFNDISNIVGNTNGTHGHVKYSNIKDFFMVEDGPTMTLCATVRKYNPLTKKYNTLFIKISTL